MRSRAGAPRGWATRLPGFERVDAFLASVSDAVARQPWFDRTIASLRGVTPVHAGSAGRFVRDGDGRALRLAPVDVWPLFALSGGVPVDLVAEWDGEVLLPLALVVDGGYHALWKGAT